MFWELLCQNTSTRLSAFLFLVLKLIYLTPLHQNPGASTIDQYVGGYLKGHIFILCTLDRFFLVGAKLSFARDVMCPVEGFESMFWTQLPNVEPNIQSLETILKRDLEKDSK